MCIGEFCVCFEIEVEWCVDVDVIFYFEVELVWCVLVVYFDVVGFVFVDWYVFVCDVWYV